MKQQAGSIRMFLCLYVALHAVPGARGADPAPSGPSEYALQVRSGLPFQDNAVLQQKIPLPLWGTSLPSARVTVTFDDQSKTTVGDKEGAWQERCGLRPAGRSAPPDMA